MATRGLIIAARMRSTAMGESGTTASFGRAFGARTSERGLPDETVSRAKAVRQAHSKAIVVSARRDRGRGRTLAPTSSGCSSRCQAPGMACRLIVTLPITDDGPDVDAIYEDVGELDGSSRAGLKALYSDARKRAAVAAGIGAYLYTSLEAVVLAIGPHPRQVQCVRRQGKSDLLVLSPETEQWLRRGYETRMSAGAVLRDLGEILVHGELERGIGQGEVADQAAQPAGEPAAAEPAGPAAIGHGEVVAVDFGDLGPAAA